MYDGCLFSSQCKIGLQEGSESLNIVSVYLINLGDLRVNDISIHRMAGELIWGRAYGGMVFQSSFRRRLVDFLMYNRSIADYLEEV